MREPIRVPASFGDGDDRLQLSPTGARLAVFAYARGGYREKHIAVHDPNTGALLDEGAFGDCRGWQFVSDNELLLAEERRVLRWRVGAEPQELFAFEEFVYGFAADPAHGRYARALSSNHHSWEVALHDAAGAQLWRAYVPFGLSAHQVALSPGGRFVAVEMSQSRGEERAVLLLDASTGRAAQTWYGPCLCDLAFAADDSFAVCVPARFDVRALEVYEPANGFPARTLDLADDFGRVVRVGFAPGGARLNVIVEDGSQSVLDVATGEELEWFAPPAEVHEYAPVALSANGRIAAGISAAYEVVVWQLGEVP